MVKYNRINEIRCAKGLSHEDLAKLSGLSKSTVCNISNYKTIPTQTTMVKIAHALNIQTYKLFELNYEKLKL